MTWLLVAGAAWLAVSVAAGLLIGRAAALEERFADRDHMPPWHPSDPSLWGRFPVPRSDVPTGG